MTSVIAPVIPSVPSSPSFQGAQEAPRRASASKPPLPRLAGTIDRPGTTIHRLATIDCHGRIADREVIRALGWQPHDPLSIHEDGRLIVVSADENGPRRVTGQGHLHLPIGIQRWHGLKAGDRLLLSGDRSSDQLVVCPPPALDEMVTTYLAAALGGEIR